MKRLFALSVIAILPLLMRFSTADAGVGGTSTPSGEVTVWASSAPVYGSGGGGNSNGPICRWQALTRGEVADIGGNGAGSTLTPAERRQTAARTINGRLHILYVVGCANTTTLRYVATGITAADLTPGAVDIARSRIQPPAPDINPAPDTGGIVNLGLWLAVQPATINPIHAEAGPAWITLTPQHTTTTFDLGNGDTTTCDGAGTPITDLDTTEQGPCGYTYRQSSPDNQPYQLTITTTWTLPYTSSDGAGTLPPLTATTTIDYNVDEIQTIGANN